MNEIRARFFSSAKVFCFVLFPLVFDVLFPINSYSATFHDFINELRGTLFSVQGKATIFGYTQDFAFGKIVEGTFKEGDIVIIKDDTKLHENEELAFGEVENIKGNLIKIYITSYKKPLTKLASVIGIKRIYANIKIEDNNFYLKSLFLKEKDIQIQEKQDEKTNVNIFFTKKSEHTYGYKVISPSGRMVLIGNVSFEKEMHSPTTKISNASIVFDDQNNHYWLLEGKELTCHSCSNTRTIKIDLDGSIINTYFDRNQLVLWSDKNKSLSIDKEAKTTILDGYLTQGEELLYFASEHKLYDITKTKIILDTEKKVDFIYKWQGEIAVASDNNKLILLDKGVVLAELALADIPLFKIKGDNIYVYREVREDVPLSGAYLSLFFEIYDLRKFNLIKRQEISETLISFDVDEKKQEIIGLKPDGTIKRIKY